MPRVPVDLVERYGALIRNPVEQLRFIRLCGERRVWPRWMVRAAALEALAVASAHAVRGLSGWESAVLQAYGSRRAGVAVVVIATVSLSGFWLARRTQPRHRAAAAVFAPPVREEARPSPLEPVWLVESGNAELYSNGLRVLNDFAGHTGPRSYAVSWVNDARRIEWRQHPAGIVYHTTESELPALEPRQRGQIQRRELGLLGYVQQNGLYHFVIDRFGRVFRVVPESEYANHAGHSVWVWNGEVYLNLNHAFLGVAFEGRTGQPAGVTTAQWHSAGLVTQMLRSRYSIVEGNCVSHDLVSVNPDRMLLGHHTDWAGGFPYAALGLPDQYQRPAPAVAWFGFRYDAAFVAAMGGKVWPGIRLAEEQLEREAARRGLSPAHYRRQLAQDYRRRRS